MKIFKLIELRHEDFLRQFKAQEHTYIEKKGVKMTAKLGKRIGMILHLQL